VNRETRRRLLLGSFILDTQQAALFEQQSVLFPRWPTETVSAHVANLPYPCDKELWECRKVDDWAELASSYQQISLSSMAHPSGFDDLDSLDSFRSRLILAYLATSGSDEDRDSGLKLAAFGQHITDQDPSGQYAGTKFDIHAHAAAQHTPVRSLLTVSGESWLFGKKLENKDDFHAAKAQLRAWLGSSGAQAALCHAIALLRMVFGNEPPTLAEAAYEIAHEDRWMGMLHQEWCIYLAALICWACTFNESSTTAESLVASSSFSASIASSTSMLSPMLSGATTPATTVSSAVGYPLLMDPVDADNEMRTFLQVTDVGGSGEVSVAVGRVKVQMKGLLEVVRTRKLNGSLGGLLNEASGVLYRLVEGRSTLPHF
jgi:hypothetical protein